MIEALFAQQKDWVVQKPLQPMLAIAKQAGFTQQTFDEVLWRINRCSDGIEEGRQRAAQKFDVQSTPTFFINGKLVPRDPHDGGAGQADGALSQGLIRVFSE